MAEVIPFRGELYNPKKIGDIKQVIAPPYDVISEEGLRALRQRSAFNIVHLLLPPSYPTDTEMDNRYTRTTALLHHWRWTRVLIREVQPAFYLYEQQFVVHDLDGAKRHVRRSLLARVKLEPFDSGVIFPHEKTLAAPKEDRLQLLRACHTNLSPVFGLYSDPEAEVERLFARTLEKPPLIDVWYTPEQRERLWCVKHPETIEAIRALFEPKSLVIADGHHRYETALFYRDEYLRQHPDAEGCRYVLMALVRMESPGLVVLPIHRLIHDLPAEHLRMGWGCLKRFVRMEPCETLSEMVHQLHHADGTAFGVYASKYGHFLLRLREDVDVTPYLDPAHSDDYNALDVTRLHAILLKACFSIDTSVVEQQRHVSYTEDPREAVERVASGQAQMAFFLNPTRVDQVRDVAMAGETMPQKSTFFYPKLMTGLVLNPLD